MTLKVIGLCCSLKHADKPSNTEVLLGNIVESMRHHSAIDYEVIRVVDHDVKPGVEQDEGDGDEWPRIAKKVLGAEILLFGSPIWVGHPSSVAQRVMERMDSFLFNYNELGQKLPYNRVAGVAVVGNEDGGHHVCAEISQALIDFGFTIPPEARAYWTGWTADSPGPEYADAGQDDEYTNFMIAHCANSLVHLARLLRDRPIPPLPADLEAVAEEQGRAARGLH